MVLPDCKTDEFYNEKYLKGGDADFVSGFDFCINDAIATIFDNLEDSDEEISFVGIHTDLGDFLSGNPDIFNALKRQFARSLQNERNELIMSILESKEDDEFEKRKKKVDKTGKTNIVIEQREETGDFIAEVLDGE